MPLSSLAQVELQLIMHACDLRSLLALARCSRSTLAAASSDFAWRTLSPVPVESKVHNLAALVSSSLLRHVDIRVRWVPPSVAGTDAWSASLPSAPVVSAEELDAVLSVPRLRALETHDRPVRPPTLWERILSSPAMSSLTALSCDEATPLSLFPSNLRALRSLHTVVTPRSSFPVGFFDALQHMHSLTELHVEDASSIPLCKIDQVGNCAGLRNLTLSGLCGTMWVSVLTGPGLSTSLRSLTLDSVHARHAVGLSQPDRRIDWRACFRNLRALQCLHLVRVYGLDALLEGLVEAAEDGSNDHDAANSAIGPSSSSFGAASSPPPAGSSSPSDSPLASLRSLLIDPLGPSYSESDISSPTAASAAKALFTTHWGSPMPSLRVWRRVMETFLPRVTLDVYTHSAEERRSSGAKDTRTWGRWDPLMCALPLQVRAEFWSPFR